MENENGNENGIEPQTELDDEIKEEDKTEKPTVSTKKEKNRHRRKLLTGAFAVIFIILAILVIRSCLTTDDTGKLQVSISPDDVSEIPEGAVPGMTSINANQKLYFSIKKKNMNLGVTEVDLVIEKSIEEKFMTYKRILFEVETKFPELRTTIPGVYFSETGTYRIKVLLDQKKAFTKKIQVKKMD